jgi:hypothetical protein
LQIHVVLSLVGLAAGLIMLAGLINGRLSAFWTVLFLATNILTSLTGYPLQPFGLTPARVVGTLALTLLAIALLALCVYRLQGGWRLVFIMTSTAALYLDAFVAVVQAFRKQPFLQPLAPTESEPPFVVAHLVVLLIFIALGALAAVRSRALSEAESPVLQN